MECGGLPPLLSESRLAATAAQVAVQPVQFSRAALVCAEASFRPEKRWQATAPPNQSRQDSGIIRVKKNNTRTKVAEDTTRHGGFGRCAFVEIADPLDAQNTIRKAMPSC